VNPERPSADLLALDEVVVAFDERRTLRVHPKLLSHDLDHGIDHGGPVRCCVVERPTHIVQVGLSLGIFGTKVSEPGGGTPSTLQVVGLDRLAHGARAAVHHEPERTLLVRLKFEEVVAAPERSELQGTVPRFSLLQGRMAQGPSFECRSRRFDRAGGAVLRNGNARVEGRHQARGRLPVGYGVGVTAEADRRHAASNVSTDGARKQQRARRHGHADADVPSQMDVGQDRQSDNIVGPGEPF
jgi:hypothetical protein